MFHQNNIKYLRRDKTAVGATVVFVEFVPSCRKKTMRTRMSVIYHFVSLACMYIKL